MAAALASCIFVLALLGLHIDLIASFTVLSRGCGRKPPMILLGSLDSYLQENNIDPDLSDVVNAVASACASISKRLATLPLDKPSEGGETNVQGETQKGMDVIANDVFVEKLRPVIKALASEEEESVLYGTGQTFEIAFDPLDGSSNLDINIPTGSIFGISKCETDGHFTKSGRHLVAAGYALYSSSTEFVISFGQEVVGFTLNPSLDGAVDAANAFLLSRPHIVCPTRGPYYSLNEAREPDWPDGLKRWIHDAKRGLTPGQQKYSSRYVCSLVGDFHRTLLVGGWAGNPRPHLRLLYEAAPLAFLAQAAGGKGSDGVRNLLDVEPTGLHDRVCVFLGSKDDITDLELYGDVQQGAAKYRA